MLTKDAFEKIYERYQSSGLIRELYKTKWVIYAKRPFSDPGSVIEYLGRYTHKIAISNHRIQDISEGKIKRPMKYNSKDKTEKWSIFCL
jgi:hypothetical protein